MWEKGQRVEKLSGEKLITGIVVEVDQTCYATVKTSNNPWVIIQLTSHQFDRDMGTLLTLKESGWQSV